MAADVTLDRRVICLDDDTVYRLVVGELAGPAMARADEHLDGCGDCRAVVAMVARGTGPSGDPDEGAGGGLARGAVIGRYVVGDAVGAGAMGVVYAAWDPELDRRVALKVLRDDGGSGEQAGARMQREAQAMARLAHPNVVTVHEVGAVDGRVFVAMELVAGRTLREWAVGRPWSEVCDVMVEVGKGLAAAHAAGLVHRDVKPDNVIVGEDGRARIGDFGLARGSQKSGTGTGTGSGTGIGGTPAYMAPEGLRGGVVDTRSDQFGFCVTFFEALHGERPFAGRSWAELLAATEGGVIAAGRRPVPRWLAAIVRRGLSARPDDRWPSIDALLAAIAVKRQARARRWATVAAAGAAAVAVAVAVAATAAVAVAVRDDAAPAASGPSCELGGARIAAVWDDGVRVRVRAALEAVDAPWAAGTADRVIASVDGWAAGWADADDQICADTAVRGVAPVEVRAVRWRCLELRRDELSALVERLASADREVARRAVDAVAALPAPAECREVAAGAADPLPADPAQRAEVDRVVHELAAVRAALAVGDWRSAQADGARLVRDAEAVGHQPTLADAALVQARALRAGGEGGPADAAALASLWAAERGHDDVGAARAWLELAVLAGERRELDRAGERAQHAAAAVARAGDPPSLVAALQGTMGLIAYNRGQLDVAQPLLEAALAGRQALHGEDDVEVARAWSSLGSVARARGDLGEARRLHEAALAIDRRRLGASHPDVARDLHNVAGVLRLAGDLDGALVRYREALEIERAVLGDQQVATALTRNSIGLVMMAMGKLDDAEVELEAARLVLVAKGHGDRAIAMHNLGLVAQRRGRHGEALRWFEAAARVYAETVGEGAEGPARLKDDVAVSARARRGPKAGTGTGSGVGAQIGGRIGGGAAEKPRDVGVYGSGQAWP